MKYGKVYFDDVKVGDLAQSSTGDVALVELEVWAETQKAEKVVSGRATVALPTRA